MKRLPKPELDAETVYAACVSGVSSAELLSRLESAKKEIFAEAQLYMSRAKENELHLFSPVRRGSGEQIVISEVTKDELTGLYADFMVRRDRPGRVYYDRLMLMAPLGRCPLCGFGQVSTLDHFLPKSRYPAFSILPVNLIPSCSDCNKSKGGESFDPDNQIPHPYFESIDIERDRWLSAKISETSPVTANFFVAPPDHWSPALKKRVLNYFQDLKLALRFSVEAASELASLSDFLGQLEMIGGIEKYLSLLAKTEDLNRKNSWRAALYGALSASVWYREGGYKYSPK